MSPLCILSFHHIVPYKDSLSITPELLKKALLRIREMGFEFLAYEEFIEAILYQKNVGKKRALLTFDDGYLDFYLFAFPILKELGIPAVCFLITDSIRDFKRENYDFKPKLHKDLYDKSYIKAESLDYFLNLGEILTMHKSGLIKFDSHTATHFSCNSEDKEAIQRELIKSKERIAEIFPNKKHFGFCFPKGHFNALSLELLPACGYEFAFSTIDGAFCAKDNPFLIRRIDISSNNREERDYFSRLHKKLTLYTTLFLGDWYSKFKQK